MSKGNSGQTKETFVRNFRNFKLSLAVAATIAIMLAAVATPAWAASATWNGTADANWSTLGNWDGPPAAVPGTGDTATFNNAGDANTVINLGVGVTIKTILFDTASAAAYTIGSGGVGSQTLTLEDSGAVTMYATVASNQLFNANMLLGTATAGTYTFTNDSVINTLTFAGSIQGGAGGAAGAKTLTVAGAGNSAINGIIGNGGATSLALTKSGNGILTLSGNNTYSGVTTVNAGAIRISDANALGTTGGNTVVGNFVGAALQLNGVSTAEPFNISSTGINTGGAIQAVGSSLTSTVSGAITLANAATIGADATDTLNITGGISGAKALTFAGAGNITISGTVINANVTPITKIGSGTLTFDITSPLVVAPITVNAGVFAIKTGVLGGTGLVTVNPGATLNLTSTSANRLGGRPLTMSGGTLNVSGAAAETTGTFTIGTGVSVLNNTSGNTLILGAAAPAFANGNAGSLPGIALFKGGSTINFGATPGFTGQTGGNGANNKGILPWAIFDSGSGLGSGFATTDVSPGVTVRGLGAGEFVTNFATANANVVLATNPGSIGSTTINSLTINSGGGVTMNATSLAAPTTVSTLTISSGGLLSTATSSISGGVLASTQYTWTPGANAAANTLTISGVFGGGRITIKGGGGMLVLANQSGAFAGYSGNHYYNINNAGDAQWYISEGTVQLGAHNALGDGLPRIQALAPGTTLDLTDKNQAVYMLSSVGTVEGAGGNITGSGTLMASASETFAGSFKDSVNLIKAGSGTLTLTSASPTTGRIIIAGGLTLLDGGSLLNIDATNSIPLNYGTLTIDNTGTKDLANRFKDTAAITLNGGGITFKGRAQTASTETLGAIAAAQGNSTVTVTAGGTGVNSADLTLTSLSRTVGATVNFAGTNLGQAGSNPRALISGALTGNLAPIGAVSNQIIPGVVVNGTDLAAYNATTGIGALGTTTFPAYATGTLNAAASTANFSGSGAVLSGGQTLNALKPNGAITFLNDDSLDDDTLTLTSGMIANAGQTYGTTSIRGSLTSSTGELILYGGSPTVHSVVVGTNKLILAGGTTYTLTANNLHSGGTTVNGGTLALTNNGLATPQVVPVPNATTPADGLVISGATVTMSNSAGQIASGNIVTLNGNSTLNLFGDNTLAGLVLNNIGGTVPTIKTWNAATNLANATGTLTLTGANAITTTAISAGTSTGSISITGRVTLPSSTTLDIGAATNIDGTNINPILADLGVNGLAGGGGTITKSGGGVLAFNAATVLTGTLDVTAGGVKIGTPNAIASGTAGARLADLILGANTWLNLAGTTYNSGNTGIFGSLAGAGNVVNAFYARNDFPKTTLTVGFTGANTTFSGSFLRYSDVAINVIDLQKIGSGTMTLTSGSSTASGVLTINSTGGGGIAFKDAGTNNFLSGTVVVNAGGTLTLDNNSGLLNGGTGAYVANRLANVATNLALTLNGGSFTYIGRNDTASSESTGTGALTLGTGESIITANEGAGGSGTGTSLVTFNSLTQSAAGSTANFVGTNLGTATDKLTFNSGPGLTNSILPRDAVNTVDFATWASGTGITAFTAYNAATDINLVAATGTAKTSTTTALTLTAARTINAININTNSAAIGTSGAIMPTAGLTLTSGGVLVNGTGAAISTPVLALSAEGIFRVNSGKDLTVSSAITGTAGLTKTGAGDLTLSNAEAYSGATTVNQGKLTLAGGKNTILAYQNGSGVNSAPTVTALNMNGGTLELNGNSQLVGQINSANTLAGGGGTITNSSGTAATLTSYATSANTFGGKITGNLNLTLASSIGGNLTQIKGPLITFTDQQSYTGNTIVHNGLVTLKDKGALYVGVGGTPNIELNYAGISLDNTGLNPADDLSPTRIPSNATITLNQGVIVTEPGASIDNVYSLGTVTAARSINTITKGYASGWGARVGTTYADSYGASEVFTINNLQTAGNGAIAELRITTDTLASRLVINNVGGSAVTPGAMLPPWVLVTTGGDVPGLGNFAVSSTTGYGIVDYGNTTKGAPAYAGTFASGNVTSVGATLLSNASTTTKALKLTGTLTFSAPGNSLNIESGGLIRTAGDIGASATHGVLTAGGTADSGTTDLYLVNSGPRTDTVGLTTYADIKDTYQVTGSGTAKVRLILSSGYQPGSGGPAPSPITLAGTNSYSGGTIIMGQVHMQSAVAPIILASTTNIPAGGLTMYANSYTQAALTTTAVDQIDPNNDVTIMNSGYGLTMMAGTTNHLSSLIFNNQGGMGSPLVNTAVNLILSGTGPQATASGCVIDSTNDHLYSIPNIQGSSLTLPEGGTIRTAGIAPIDLIVGAQVATSGTAPLHKTGAGSVVFTPSIAIAACGTTAGSNAVTLGSTANLSVGQSITGTGLPAGEFVASIIDGTHITVTTSTGITTQASTTLTATGNTFANGVNLDAGSIIFNTSSVGGGTGGTAPTNSPIGTGALTLANGTAIMSDGTARTIGNMVNVADNAGFTFGTLEAASVRANAGNSLTLTNTVALGSGAHTINVNGLLMTGTISGQLTGGTNLTKAGPGTLVLSGNNNYGGTTTVSAGTLKLSGAYSNNIGATTTINVAAGAGLDVTGLTGSTLVLGGSQTLKGNGAVSGNITASGGAKLAPGASAGTLSIIGNVRMDAGAIYLWELGETTADKVVVTGNLNLDNSWQVKLVDIGPDPDPDLEYDLFTYAGIYTGLASFGPGNIDASGVTWGVSTAKIFAADGRVYITGIGLTPGDTNNDGVVDPADYIAMKQNFGLTGGATLGQGDVDGNGDVNWDDLQVLMTNFGTGTSTTPATTPEPCSAMLLVLGAMAVVRRRARIGRITR